MTESDGPQQANTGASTAQTSAQPQIMIVQASTITYGILSALFFYSAVTGVFGGIIAGALGSALLGYALFFTGIVQGIVGYLVHEYAKDKA